MKKCFALVLGILCIFMLSGCSIIGRVTGLTEENRGPLATETPAPEETPVVTPKATSMPANPDKLPGGFPMEFYFSSGAGAWGTELVLMADGRFEGEFHDTNMGESGDGYPYGTVYECEFEGRFGDFKRINDTTYKMTLLEIYTDEPEGVEEIEDGVKHISSVPYGVDEGIEYIFYTPDTRVDGLSEEFLSWWPERFSDVEPDTLMHYGIYNLDTENGFFTY